MFECLDDELVFRIFDQVSATAAQSVRVCGLTINFKESNIKWKKEILNGHGFYESET